MAIGRKKYPSEAQRELFALLASGEGLALRNKLTGTIHRTALWCYATGKRRPGPAAMAALEVASGGRVRAACWLTSVEHKAIAALGAA